MAITEKELISRGYKQYRPTAINSPYCVAIFQRRIENREGDILYFINVHQFNDGGFETEVQFYKNESHKALNLLFYPDWTLDEIELYADMMYEVGTKPMFEPYETRSER